MISIAEVSAPVALHVTASFFGMYPSRQDKLHDSDVTLPAQSPIVALETAETSGEAHETA